MQDQYALTEAELAALVPGDRVGTSGGNGSNARVERVTTTRLVVRRDGMSFTTEFNRTGPRTGQERGGYDHLTRPDTPPIMRRIAHRAVSRLAYDVPSLIREATRGKVSLADLRVAVEQIEHWCALAAADLARAERASAERAS